MSESPFPFGVSSAATQDADEVSPDRRRNAIALGALAAVVIGAGAFFFLSGDPADDETAFVQPAAAAAGAAARPAAPQAVGKLPVVSKVRLGRSPFEVLYTPPKAAPASAVAPATSVTAPSGTVADPAAGPTGELDTGFVPAPLAPVSSSGSGAGAPPPASGGTDGGKPAAPKLHALTLTRVYGGGKDRTAVFTIDGKQQTAKVGGTFGPTAELLLLSLQTGPADDQWTAVLQVGDGDPFDVVTGTKVYVP